MLNIRYYVRVYRAFIKNTFSRESDYRGSMIAEIMDSILNLAVNITFFNILYLNVDSIAGWNSMEMLVLIAVTQLLTSFLYMLFMNNLPKIQKYVFQGDFDYILLKPCDEQFYVSFRFFYFGAVPNFFFSTGLLIYALIRLKANIGWIDIAVFCIYIVSGIAICYAIWLIIMALSIILLKVGQMHELFLSSLKFFEYPKGIYKGIIRVFLLYIIPLVTVSNVPAEILLGKINIINSIYIMILAFIFIGISRLTWKALLKRYNSASS